MKKNILFFVMFILMTDLFAEQVIYSSIRNDWPDSRYAEHDNGTVTDTRTGLMWKKCSEGQTYENKSCTGTATTHNWKAALEMAQKSRFADYSDWRLPNIKELDSLVARDRVTPSINNTIFPNTDSNYFWSSSPSTIYHTNSWLIDFNTGFDYYDDRRINSRTRIRFDDDEDDWSTSFHVRLVRLGQ